MFHVMSLGALLFLFAFGAATSIGTARALQDWAANNLAAPMQVAEAAQR